MRPKRDAGDSWPAPTMFETALEKMRLTEEDKPRIIMIGNNLKKDVAGANRMGLSSVWLGWPPDISKPWCSRTGSPTTPSIRPRSGFPWYTA